MMADNFSLNPLDKAYWQAHNNMPTNGPAPKPPPPESDGYPDKMAALPKPFTEYDLEAKRIQSNSDWWQSLFICSSLMLALFLVCSSIVGGVAINGYFEMKAADFTRLELEKIRHDR